MSEENNSQDVKLPPAPETVRISEMLGSGMEYKGAGMKGETRNGLTASDPGKEG
jgi:hypothetical protein